MPSQLPQSMRESIPRMLKLINIRALGVGVENRHAVAQGRLLLVSQNPTNNRHPSNPRSIRDGDARERLVYAELEMPHKSKQRPPPPLFYPRPFTQLNQTQEREKKDPPT